MSSNHTESAETIRRLYKQEYKQELQQFQIDKLMNENANMKITIEGHLRAEVVYKRDIAYWQEEYEDLKEYLAYLKKENTELRANCDQVERLLLRSQTREAARNRSPEPELILPLDMKVPQMDETESKKDSATPPNTATPVETLPAPPLKLYEPESEHDYQNYVRNNHLCLRNFCRHYNICDVAKDTGIQSVPIFCKSGNHPGKHWHIDEMRRQFPNKYSKVAALCQISRSFNARYSSKVVAQLIAAMEKDEDGYFSSTVGPTRFKNHTPKETVQQA